MKKGWIKLYKQIQDNEIWTDGEPFDKRSAFIDLLMMANFETTQVTFNGQQIELKAGQRITSIRNLAKRWKWSTNRVLRYLDTLEAAEMIEKEADKQKTIITIKNYKKYQETRHTNGDTDGDTNGDTNGDTENRIKSSKTDNGRNTNGDTNGDTSGDTDGDKKRIKEEKKKNNYIHTSKTNAERIADLYTQTCPSLPQVTKLTDTRIRAINARLKEYTEEELAEAFRKAEASPFLRGDTGKWKASFDWIMKPANIQKVLEGNYDDKKQDHKKAQYDFAALEKQIREG